MTTAFQESVNAPPTNVRHFKDNPKRIMIESIGAKENTQTLIVIGSQNTKKNLENVFTESNLLMTFNSIRGCRIEVRIEIPPTPQEKCKMMLEAKKREIAQKSEELAKIFTRGGGDPYYDDMLKMLAKSKAREKEHTANLVQIRRVHAKTDPVTKLFTESPPIELVNPPEQPLGILKQPSVGGHSSMPEKVSFVDDEI